MISLNLSSANICFRMSRISLTGWCTGRKNLTGYQNNKNLVNYKHSLIQIQEFSEIQGGRVITKPSHSSQHWYDSHFTSKVDVFIHTYMYVNVNIHIINPIMKYSIRERIHGVSYWTQQHSHLEGSCLLAKTKCALTICKTSIQEDPYKNIYYNRTTNFGA